MKTMQKNNKVVIITGGARRIGAEIARMLHMSDFNILIHYRNSCVAAESLCNELNTIRENSCFAVKGELDEFATYTLIIEGAMTHFGRIDALINNASSFYPTPIETATRRTGKSL